MEVVIILILYILIIIFDFIPLLKKDNKKIMLFYLGTSIFTLIILIIDSQGIKVPSPATLIEFVIKGMF